MWVGNFHGNPMHKISGGYGAGKIFHQIVRILHKGNQKDFNYPAYFEKRKHCKLSGLPAKEDCPQYLELINMKEKPDSVCDGKHKEGGVDLRNKMILSPSNSESFLINPTIPLHNQAIPIVIQMPDRNKGEDSYFYSLDGRPRKEIKFNIKENLIPSRGNHKILIYREKQIIEEAEFSVE